MTLHNQVGSFCWWSLMTHDVPSANRFYQDLFDWKLDQVDIPDRDPSTIYVAGHGGFANPSPLEENSATSSHWIVYITVEDVDQSCRVAEELGGSVPVPAFSVPTIGRTAVISDPVGTPFHLFTPFNEAENFNMIGNETGEICWMELMVNDPTPLFSFYTDLFGWKFSDSMQINGGEYTSFEINGEKVGGLMKRPPDVPDMPPMWMNYFSVPSVDEWSAKARSLGGKILLPKLEIPETGYLACMEDPSGACAYLFEMWE